MSDTRFLAGINVIEVGNTIAPAYAGRLLADLGADVTVVEPPGGNALRRNETLVPNLAAYLAANKASAVYDAALEHDPGYWRSLCSQADILLFDDTIPALRALVVEQELYRTMPFVATLLTPWGLGSPYAGLCDDELLLFAASGLATLVPVFAEDRKRERPMQLWGHQAAMLAGLNGALAAVQGWMSTQKTGLGRLIDLASIDSLTTMPVLSLAAAFAGQPETSPSGFLRCSDGYVFSQNRFNDSQWAEMVGLVDWSETADPGVLASAITAWLEQHAAGEVCAALQERGAAAFPINTVRQVTLDRQSIARQVFQQVIEQPGGRFFEAPRTPIRRWNELPGPADEAVVSSLGADTARVGTSPDRERQAPEADAAEPAKEEELPLAGIRVADFSWVIQGPRCTQWLAALGADVVKIESHMRYDQARQMKPFLTEGGSLESGIPFNMLNNSKLSCSINLGSADGRKLARRIVDEADILVENWSFGVANRLGLDYESLTEGHPGLVMISCSGLGRTGPDAGARAYGTPIHAYTGHLYLSAWPDTPPRGFGGAWTDPLVGSVAALAVVAGLVHAQRTAAGSYFDISMAEATISIMAEAFLEYFATGSDPKPVGNVTAESCPHNTYECADGRWVAIAVHGDEEWSALLGLLTARPHVDGLRDRLLLRDEIDVVLDDWCRAKDRDELVRMLRSAGVCAVPVNTLGDWLASDHLAGRGLVVEATSSDGCRYPLIAPPWREDPPRTFKYSPAPGIGEHNEHILSDFLGLSPDEVAATVTSDAMV